MLTTESGNRRPTSRPYERNGQYYHDECLCLWQVTAAEIVGYWAWNDLENDKDWYQNIILPAFQRFTKPAAASGVTGEVDTINDLQSSFADLSGMFIILASVYVC